MAGPAGLGAAAAAPLRRARSSTTSGSATGAAVPEARTSTSVDAAIAADADGFVRALPAGYATPLGERGTGLSSGQRQRVALARAWLRADASLLLLDEPTARLDPATEAAVVAASVRLAEGRTALLVAHRPALLAIADRGGARYEPDLLLRLIGAGLLAVATELAGIGLVGTATWLIVRAAEQPPLAALSVAIVAVRALALAKGGLRYVERLAGHDAVLRVLVDLRARVFAAIVADRSSVRAADLLSRAVSDVDGVQDAILRCYLPAAVAVVISAGAVAVTLAVSVVAGLIVLAGLVVGGLVLPYLGDRLSRATAGRIAAARADVVTATVDVVHGAADLAAFGALPAFLADASARNARLARLEARSGAIAGVVGALAFVVPAGLAIALAGSGPVLALVALAVAEVVVPLAGAAVHHAGLRGAFARLLPLLRGSSGEMEPGRPLLPRSSGIELRDALVQYNGEKTTAIDHVSLHLPVGARVAVIGPSGSGKSTLLGILAGQVPLSGGTLGGVTPGWPAVGGVLADAHVFHVTVRENILLGRPHLTDEDARRALTAAGLAGWTDRLDRIVGEDGGEISGGQRQRLLLARALVELPSVLLLDEPTEGLDAATADAVLDAALDAAGPRTVVVVTHRHAHLTRFDLVIALADGRRVPIGVIPEELTLGGVGS